MNPLQTRFDNVAKALIAQGKPAYEGSSCKYRTASGLKCAVGTQIPDDKYNPRWDEIGFSLQSEAHSGKVYQILRAIDVVAYSDEFNMLSQLQYTHDAAAGRNPNRFDERWYDEMRNIAKGHHLECSL